MNRRALLLTHLDLFYLDNTRHHYLRDALKKEFDELTVLYVQHCLRDGWKAKLKSFFTIAAEYREEDGVRYIGVKPLFVAGHSHKTYVDEVGGEADGAEVSVLGRLQATVKTWLLEGVGVLGHCLEAWHPFSFAQVVGSKASYSLAADYDVAVAGGVWAIDYALKLRGEGVCARVVVDDYDWSPGNYVNSACRRAWVRRKENALLLQADVVISIGSMLAELRTQECGGRAIEVVPNGIIYERFAQGQVKVPHPPTLIYTGAVQEWSGIHLGIEAVASLSELLPDLRFLIIGHALPHYQERLRSMIVDLHLQDRVELLGKMPNESLPAYFQQADLGLATFEPIALRRYAVSLKVGEYMGAGLCPIVTEGLQSADLVRQPDSGYVVPYSAEGIARAVKEYFEDLGQAEELRSAAIAKARALDWQALTAQYLRVATGQAKDVLLSTEDSI